MSEPRRAKRKSSLRRKAIRRMVLLLRNVWWITLVLAIAVILLAISRGESLPALTMPLHTPTPLSAAVDTVTTTPTVPIPTPTPWPTLTPFRPKASPVPKGRRIGILAGHLGPENDPGAVCPDGLREVDINVAVAERVVAALRSQGYEVDLLEEFDERLDGYQADAFVSIHSDSCEIQGASGFKVARAEDSAIPDVEDRLVEWLYQEYEVATGLPRHESSITPAMHGYHAFRQIAIQTPGAIIELGFMLGDRRALTSNPDRLAQGIVNGLVCFLEPEAVPTP
jgi:N-acetylmuramoyl-L-alanine amidase